jgi:hypothetical protein
LTYFRAQYFNYKWIEIVAVLITVLVILGISVSRPLLKNLHGVISIVTGLQVFVFMMGSKFMSYQVLSGYGIRGLSLFILSSFLWIVPLVKRWTNTRSSRAIRIFQSSFPMLCTALAVMLLMQTDKSLQGTHPLHFLQVLSRTTPLSLMYPEQDSKLCRGELKKTKNCVFAVSKGNYVSIKQLGFGSSFYGQWVSRIDFKTNNCLKEEFNRQTRTARFKNVSLDWLANCSKKRGNQS